MFWCMGNPQATRRIDGSANKLNEMKRKYRYEPGISTEPEGKGLHVRPKETLKFRCGTHANHRRTSKAEVNGQNVLHDVKTAQIQWQSMNYAKKDQSVAQRYELCHTTCVSRPFRSARFDSLEDKAKA